MAQNHFETVPDLAAAIAIVHSHGKLAAWQPYQFAVLLGHVTYPPTLTMERYETFLSPGSSKSFAKTLHLARPWQLSDRAHRRAADVS